MKRSVLGAPPRKGTGTALHMFIWSAAIGVLLALSPLGCAGSLDPGVTGNGGGGLGGAGGGSGAACQDTIFMNQCVSCHNSVSPTAGLDLQSANIPVRLVGVATGAGSACPGGTLLVANVNPASGVFIDKITNDPPTCGGSVMPFGQKMNATDIACLTTWANGITGTP
jgi:hypothetical protein